MSVQSTGRKEEQAAYYNKVYVRAESKGGYDTERYNEVYNIVMNHISDASNAMGQPPIVECGCGTGALAERIIHAGYSYAGFDFSQEAINQCHWLVRRQVGLCDAYKASTWRTLYPARRDTDATIVVAVEVFEHLDDLRVLKMIPQGTRVIFSVPDFNSESHLRTYSGYASIIQYYDGVLDMQSVRRVQTQPEKAIYVCDSIKI